MSITTLSSVAVGTTGTAALSMGNSSRRTIPKLGMLMNGVQLNGIFRSKAALFKRCSIHDFMGERCGLRRRSRRKQRRRRRRRRSSSSRLNYRPGKWAFRDETGCDIIKLENGLK